MFCIKILIFSIILIEFSHSSPTTEFPHTTFKVDDFTASEPDQDFITEANENPPIIDDETFHIATDSIYKISFSVGGEWSQNFVDKNSAAFKSLRDQLDIELREIIDGDSHAQLASGIFRLVKVFPSVEENFLFVTLLMEAKSEEIANEWKDAIENQFLINNKLKLSEIPAKIHGDLNMMKVSDEEIEFIENYDECQSEFCKSIPEPSLDSTILSDDSKSIEESHQCSPREEIQRGSTSIFIFEDLNCVDKIKSKFSPQKPSTCSLTNNEVRDDSENSVDHEKFNADEDPMTAQASEHHQQFAVPESVNDDQTIVVIKKRGNKVFIEI